MLKQTRSLRTGRGKSTAILAVAAAMAIMNTAFADEPYQYIKTPGYDPVIYSTSNCSVVASAAAPLTTGTQSLPTEPSSLEARFRTWLESLGTALKSTKYRIFMIKFN